MVFKRLNKNKMENKEFLKLVIEIGQDFLSEYFFNNFDYVVQSQEFKNIDELLEKYQKYMERHITETIKLSQKRVQK
jgi:F0F1-type ATP synthase delta subunit